MLDGNVFPGKQNNPVLRCLQNTGTHFGLNLPLHHMQRAPQAGRDLEGLRCEH